MLKKGRCKISCSKVKHRSLSALLVITVRRMSVTYEPSKMVVSEQVAMSLTLAQLLGYPTSVT